MEDFALYLRDAIYDVIHGIEEYENSADPAVDLQRVILKLDYAQRIAMNINMDDGIIVMIGNAYRMVVQIENNLKRCGAPLHRSGQRGRPSFDISEEQLSFLLEKGFQIKIFARERFSDISAILGVSCRTVERRMSNFGLSVSGTVPSNFM